MLEEARVEQDIEITPRDWSLFQSEYSATCQEIYNSYIAEKRMPYFGAYLRFLESQIQASTKPGGHVIISYFAAYIVHTDIPAAFHTLPINKTSDFLNKLRRGKLSLREEFSDISDSNDLSARINKIIAKLCPNLSPQIFKPPVETNYSPSTDTLEIVDQGFIDTMRLIHKGRTISAGKDNGSDPDSEKWDKRLTLFKSAISNYSSTLLNELISAFKKTQEKYKIYKLNKSLDEIITERISAWSSNHKSAQLKLKACKMDEEEFIGILGKMVVSNVMLQILYMATQDNTETDATIKIGNDKLTLSELYEDDGNTYQEKLYEHIVKEHGNMEDLKDLFDEWRKS